MNRRTFVLLAALSVCACPLFARQAQQVKKPAAPASTEVLNLNTATAAQLATLPGVGPKTADLIVQYRTKNGSFKKIEEIMNIRGVGEKSFLKLKSRITVASVKPE